jgi:hypothetical protein
MRRGLGVLVVVLSVLSMAQAASAHDTTSFRACTVSRGGCGTIGSAFLYGDTVIVRGQVRPPHAGYTARVLRRDPRSDGWVKVAEVTVSESGTMRYRWRTEYEDADQRRPYLFRFKIPGHGTSNTTEAYVLFGE